jgi:glycosyltransferase involved in cell wall biosynthesis
VSTSSSLVVMLTPDREQIDRRILLQAHSLSHAGYRVTLVGLPSLRGGQAIPAGVDLVTATPGRSASVALGLGIWRSYRRLVASPMPARGARWLRWILESLWVNPAGSFAASLREPALALRGHIYVAHDLPVLPVAIEAGARIGARIVYDAHELYPEQEFSPLLRRRWRRIERESIARVDAVTTVNPAIAVALERRYGIPRPIVLYSCPPWQAPAEPAPRRFHERWLLDRSTRIVLYQGGLTPHRNLEGLLRAMRHVRRRDVIIVLMGDGSERRRLSALAGRLGLEGRVRFHPAVAPEALLDYTASADLGIIPYLASSENTRLCTPNKLFELIQAEVPILAHELPELRRIVAGEGLGLVRDLATPEGIALAIDEYFEAAGDGEAYRDALRRAKKRYSWERQERELLDVYRRIDVRRTAA